MIQKLEKCVVAQACKSVLSQVTALSKYMASKFSTGQCENVTGLICHLAGLVCSYY